MKETVGLWETEPVRARRAVALIRLGLVPVIFLSGSVTNPGVHVTRAFGLLLAAAGLYAVGTVVAAFHRGPDWLGPIEWVIDITLLAALTYASGGAASEVRRAFYVLPVAAALLLGPRHTAGWSALAVLGYGAVSVAHPSFPMRFDDRTITVHLLYLGATGAVATLLSANLARWTGHVTALAQERSELVLQVAATRDDQRRRLADALHDDAIQNLLAARQDLRDAVDGRSGALELADEGLANTIEQLREAVFELHPHLLETAGLGAALRAVARSQERRGGFTTVLTIPADLDAPSELLFGIARELIVNAAKHAHATTVRVTLERHGDCVTLACVDDGVGFQPHERSRAVASGHVGLSLIAERIRAAGGTFTIGSGAVTGTRVLARLPAAAIHGPGTVRRTVRPPVPEPHVADQAVA